MVGNDDPDCGSGVEGFFLESVNVHITVSVFPFVVNSSAIKYLGRLWEMNGKSAFKTAILTIKGCARKPIFQKYPRLTSQHMNAVLTAETVCLLNAKPSPM